MLKPIKTIGILGVLLLQMPIGAQQNKSAATTADRKGAKSTSAPKSQAAKPAQQKVTLKGTLVSGGMTGRVIMRSGDEYYFLTVQLPKGTITETKTKTESGAERTVTSIQAPAGQMLRIFSPGDKYIAHGTLRGTITAKQVYDAIGDEMSFPRGMSPELRTLIEQNRRLKEVLLDSIEPDEGADAKQP
jgi:hypothetical protein